MTKQQIEERRDKVVRLYIEEEKSINGEICYILKKYIEEYKKAKENSK